MTAQSDTATGDRHRHGLARWLHGANMEFIQFHPTCLYHLTPKSFLISKRAREGGVLRLADGRRCIARRHDPRAELAAARRRAPGIDSR